MGAGLHLVGGAVRDLLLGAAPRDLDVSFEGEPGRIESELAPALGASIESRSQFGAYVLTVGGETLDVATARRESYPHPGALPVVSPGSMDDDLARRDFSINAMAVGLMPSEWGVLRDPHGGRADLRDGVIRVLHPASFTDDPTRILRAVRYSRRLGFRLEAGTEALARADAHRLRSLSGARVRREMEHLLREERAVSMLHLAQDLGVLGAVHPSLELRPDALDRLRKAAGGLRGDSAATFAALVALGGGDAESLARRLSLGARRTALARDAKRLRGLLPRLSAPEMSPSAVVELLEGTDSVAVSTWALLSEDPLASARLRRFHAELRHVSPLLDGNDLIAMGVAEGPDVGALLAELRRGRLDGELATADDERRYVARRLGGSG